MAIIVGMVVERILPIVSALVAWSLTVALVYNMLSGTFDERVCQTVCVQAIYWSAVAATALGVAISVFALRREKTTATVISLLALLALAGIFATTMTIGVVRTTFGI